MNRFGNQRGGTGAVRYQAGIRGPELIEAAGLSEGHAVADGAAALYRDYQRWSGRGAEPACDLYEGTFCRCAFQRQLKAYARQLMGAGDAEAGHDVLGAVDPLAGVDGSPEHIRRLARGCALLQGLVWGDHRIAGCQQAGLDLEALSHAGAAPDDLDNENLAVAPAGELKKRQPGRPLGAMGHPELPEDAESAEGGHDLKRPLHNLVHRLLSCAWNRREKAEPGARETASPAKPEGQP